MPGWLVNKLIAGGQVCTGGETLMIRLHNLHGTFMYSPCIWPPSTNALARCHSASCNSCRQKSNGPVLLLLSSLRAARI